jgi:hypothetical protein
MSESKILVEGVLDTPSYLTVKQFAARFPAFTEGALRNLIFHAKQRCGTKGATQGNWVAGSLVRVGRRVLINVPRFFESLEKQSAQRTMLGHHGARHE